MTKLGQIGASSTTTALSQALKFRRMNGSACIRLEQGRFCSKPFKNIYHQIRFQMGCMEGSDRRGPWQCANPSPRQTRVHLRHFRLQQRRHRSHTIPLCDNIKEQELGSLWRLWPTWAGGEARGKTWKPLQPEKFSRGELDTTYPSLGKL